MAFESLTDRLAGVFKKLRGHGKLTEADIKTAMREVRMDIGRYPRGSRPFLILSEIYFRDQSRIFLETSLECYISIVFSPKIGYD